MQAVHPSEVAIINNCNFSPLSYQQRPAESIELFKARRVNDPMNGSLLASLELHLAHVARHPQRCARRRLDVVD